MARNTISSLVTCSEALNIILTQRTITSAHKPFQINYNSTKTINIYISHSTILLKVDHIRCTLHRNLQYPLPVKVILYYFQLFYTSPILKRQQSLAVQWNDKSHILPLMPLQHQHLFTASLSVCIYTTIYLLHPHRI